MRAASSGRFARVLAAIAVAASCGVWACTSDERAPAGAARTEDPAAAAPAASPPAAPVEPTQARGAQVYAQHKCALCHSIAGVGDTRHPLDGVGARLRRVDIENWIVAPREMDPKVRKPSFEMPAHDLSALVDYLAGLREPVPN